MDMKKCEVCGARISKKSKICPYCNERANKISSSAIRTFFIWFVLMIVIGLALFGSESVGSNEIIFSPPTWYIFACYIIPAIVTALKINKIKNGSSKKNGNSSQKKVIHSIFESAKAEYQKKVNPNNEFIIPKSAKRQREVAEKLLESAKADAELANKEDNLQLFIMFYDDAVKNLEKISMLEKSGVKDQAERDVWKLKGEIQWHLCDALVRQKEKTVSEIRGKYRNSKEFQVKQYESFKTDIEEARPRFSQDTADFAEKCLREVGREVGITFEEKRSAQAALAYDSLVSIDFMEGHQFEHWCAALLQKIGFVNVEVTQGSGDQGVDVLAEKDGIKYAIQCKCYSSDLGNKPIQEVNTGKAIYRCQIGAVITNRHFTQGGKEAAMATGVLLWDRDWIQEKLKEIKK